MSSPQPVPARGLTMIATILIAMAVLALYANVQKYRREKIETITVAPIATPTPTPGRQM